MTNLVVVALALQVGPKMLSFLLGAVGDDDLWSSAYEKGLPGLPGKSLGVGLKMVSDSKPVGEK